MEWYIIVIGVLAAAVIVLALKLVIIRHDIKEFDNELKNTREESYNRMLTVTLSDTATEKLAATINDNLSYQKELKLKEERQRKSLESSVSDIAHDLRTPLTVVKGNLQMLEKEELSDSGVRYLDAALRKTDSLKDMVDTFFELSVLESDDVTVNLSKLDIVSFLAGFVVDNEAVIRGNNLEPNINLPEKSIFIKADKDMMNRVFSNLLNNILKYAKDTFNLSVSKNEGKCEIVLSNPVANDDAIDTEHIFDRTYRADKARTTGSAGLGLYIVKLLVNKQGGSITAEIADNILKFKLII